jgi:predicted nucleic acid-binding Zn ribbon protein
MEILPVYREDCENCNSHDTQSFIQYMGVTITIVCKNCGHRKVKK